LVVSAKLLVEESVLVHPFARLSSKTVNGVLKSHAPSSLSPPAPGMIPLVLSQSTLNTGVYEMFWKLAEMPDVAFAL
jgi:hypothetical protein